MPSLADFNHEPPRNTTQTIPSAYALRLHEAWYKRQAGVPPEYVQKEIEAYHLFSHVFQCIGMSAFRIVKGEDSILTRKRVANPVTLRRPDRYTVTLFETSYMDPNTREWRGVTPGMGFSDVDGNVYYTHEQSALATIDWLASGPFLSPSSNYNSLQNMAARFEAGIVRADPHDAELALHLERQKMYVETLDMLASSTMSGRPDLSHMSLETDFIVPRVHPPGWYLN